MPTFKELTKFITHNSQVSDFEITTREAGTLSINNYYQSKFAGPTVFHVLTKNISHSPSNVAVNNSQSFVSMKSISP